MAESVLLWGENGIAGVFHWKGNNWIWIAEWNNRHAETFKQTVIKKQTNDNLLEVEKEVLITTLGIKRD